MAGEDLKMLAALERIARAIEAIARKTDPEFKTALEEKQEMLRQPLGNR